VARLARRLADDLEQSDKLSDPAWRAAVCGVPRVIATCAMPAIP